jgi:serine phosphatase RsbU (regulator of sigma subunit)
MSLRWRISLYFAFLIIILFLSVFLIIREENIKNFKNLLEKEAKSAAKSLAIASKDFLLEERIPDLVKLCYEIKGKEEKGEIVYSFVVDHKNFIKGSFREDFIGKNIYEFGNVLKDTNLLYEDEIVFNRVVDIIYMNKIIGKAVVGVSSRNLNISLKNMQKRMFLIFTILLFVGFLGVFLIGTYLAHPVSKIIKAIEKIGKGDFDIYIGLKRKDEIGKIAREIEKMSEDLRIAQKEILEKERMKRDIEIAEEIQKVLIPSQVPNIPEYEIEFFYKPAFFVSGDYIDVIKIPFDRIFIVLADVSGKGVGSSLLMGMIKMNTLSIVKGVTTPKSFLISLFNSLRDLIPEEMFITIAVCILERDGNLFFTSAGHFPPILYRKNKKIFEKIEINSLPLGFSFLNITDFADSLKEEKIEMERGDILMIYTDGLLEIENEYGENFGEERIKNIIFNSGNGVAEIKKRLIKEIEIFRGEKEIKDDISFLIISRK